MSQKSTWKRNKAPGGAREIWKTASCWLRRQRQDKQTADGQSGEEFRSDLFRGKI